MSIPANLPTPLSQSFTSSSESLDKQIKETHELSDTSKYDAGWKSDAFYKSQMSPMRYQFRAYLIRLIEKETGVLASIQTGCRSAFNDIYFPYTANLGSHTFYVIMLPMTAWFGNLRLFRDLVIVLGLGIYFSGLLKDYLCLPRPKSPPLTRITLSHYTSKEYGCPSSHTANATGVTMLILQELISRSADFSFTTNLIAFFLLFLYYSSLLFGRIYCGMHGFVDLTAGSVIGVSLVLIRNWFGDLWDQFVFQPSPLVPIFVILAYYSLIYYHTTPLDACPCFDDSVAFIGVLLGLELSHWIICNSALAYPDPALPCIVPYDYAQLGLLKTIIRVLIGVVLVVVWKAVSKPILTKLFKPIHSKAMILLDLDNSKKNDDNVQDSSLKHQRDEETCGAWKPRYNLEIFVRLAVYSGIAVVAVVGCNIVFKSLGLAPEY